MHRDQRCRYDVHATVVNGGCVVGSAIRSKQVLWFFSFFFGLKYVQQDLDLG